MTSHRSPRAALSALVLFSLLATPALRADVPAPKPAAPKGSERWEKEIAAYEAADKTNMPAPGGIVFTGASGIRMWKTLASDFPGENVINRGFGGSEMADSAHFADRIVTPYKPRLVVVQAGGNDINAGKSPEQVLADFKAFVEKVRAKLPDTRIAYLSMNPSPSRWAQRDKQQKGNQLVKAYIDAGKNLDYIDFWGALLGPDGQPREDLFIADKLHNNAAGYKIRADVVRPHLTTVKVSGASASTFAAADGTAVELYNGKDLTGWGYKTGEKFDGKTESDDHRYTAKGETIVVNPGTGTKQLWTTEKFPTDFTLTLEFRAGPRADSGLFIRGPQLQVRDYVTVGPYKTLKKYKPQDWNTIEVVVKGNLAHCTCNGELLEDALKIPATGGIGLEADKGTMEYRNIRLVAAK